MCPECESTKISDEVEDTWRCPKCKSLIHVHIECQTTGDRIALIRKQASELDEGDLFLFNGKLNKESYLILGIKTSKNQLAIGLKGWGQVKLTPNTPVNCRIGMWE